MNDRLKILYTYLIENRKHELVGWYNDYKKFVTDVQKIKENLTIHSLDDKEAYAGTSFFEKDTPKWHFFKKFFANKSNGVSSNGRSILKDVDFKSLVGDEEFIRVIEDLIKNPSLDNHNLLRQKWQDKTGGNNPVLTNRATATCSMNLTSTVNETYFSQVFNWLLKQELISTPIDITNDWYSQNTFVISQLKGALMDVDGADYYWISIFYWEMYENLSNPFSLKKQIVKYGAPGTGKTYIAEKTARLQFDIWKSEFTENLTINFNDCIETIQFHPSYSYEDFIEGLRPDLDGKLTLENGIFKSLCKKAGKWEVDIFNLDSNINFEELKVSEILEKKDQLDGVYWSHVFNQNGEKLVKDLIPPYFIIIDEINRAELSRVFGELMYCLEYRGIAGKLKTQYSQLNSNRTGMLRVGDGYQFFVPNNLYIIGTMNTVDRSVESFDFALRRRFKWEEVLPSASLLRYHLKSHNSKWIELANNLEELNQSIESEMLLGKDYCIGHAYLWNLPYSKNLSISEVRRTVWDDSISSLLEEYLRGTGRNDLLKKFTKSFGL